MVKFTNYNLKKIEELLKELGYVVRYEKGNFNSGYCLVEQKQIIVINRFFETEGRINCMLDILSVINPKAEDLSEKNQVFYKKLIA